MRNVLLGLILVCICAGCLTTTPPEGQTWLISPREDLPCVAPSQEGAPTLFQATRLGAVSVNAPFDRAELVVRRADGTIAFDHFNLFAASPMSLLRAPMRVRLAADGRFGHIVPPASVAQSDCQVEVLVTDLSLDCSDLTQRVARAAVSVDVVKTDRTGRTVALVGDGASTCDAASGNYSRAFSTAFDGAVEMALKNLK